MEENGGFSVHSDDEQKMSWPSKVQKKKNSTMELWCEKL